MAIAPGTAEELMEWGWEVLQVSGPEPSQVKFDHMAMQLRNVRIAIAINSKDEVCLMGLSPVSAPIRSLIKTVYHRVGCKWGEECDPHAFDKEWDRLIEELEHQDADDIAAYLAFEALE